MSLPYNNNCPIGVFDSGLGGLSVLTEIHKLLPAEKLIYVGDSANMPYGDRSTDFVLERSFNIANFLVDQNVKALVIACNTATAEAIDIIRDNVDIPIIGLEPAIKPAANTSKSGVIGVLATQRTIDSKRLLALTERYATGTKVIAQACPGLVEQVEACEFSSETTYSLLNKFIQPLLEQNVDTLILGCTHYPFLLPAIRQLVGEHVHIIETAKPVALQLQRMLEKHQLNYSVNSDTDSFGLEVGTHITLYNSNPALEITKSMQYLWQLSINDAQHSKLTEKISPAATKPIEVLPLPTLNYTYD